MIWITARARQFALLPAANFLPYSRFTTKLMCAHVRKFSKREKEFQNLKSLRRLLSLSFPFRNDHSCLGQVGHRLREDITGDTLASNDSATAHADADSSEGRCEPGGSSPSRLLLHLQVSYSQ